MNRSKYLRRAASLLAFLPVMMTGQRAQDVAPLKNWAAPLYWQANQTEREASRQGAAQFQISPNAISNTALIFVAVSSCRMVDTRGASVGFIGSTPFNGPYIPAGQTVAFPVQSTTEAQTSAPSPCGTIPSVAQAYSLNLTLVPHPFGNPVNYVTMWPDNGSAIPIVSTVNDWQGGVVANAAIVPAGTNSGGIKVFAYSATDVIIDMNGFYAAPTDVTGNTAIGDGTLSSNSGVNNTTFGDLALGADTTGSANAATGAFALFKNTTGIGNTANGFEALFNNISGNYNTAVGYGASDGIFSAGQYNTFIGYQTGTTVPLSIVNATAIGANATVNEGNALVLGGTGTNSVSVGIGTPTPSGFYSMDIESPGSGSLNGGILVNAAGGNVYLGMTNGTKVFRVSNTGMVYADGGVQSSGADFAESVSVSGSKSLYEPGDLLVIKRGGYRSLTQSHTPYSTLVAGIYSTKPGMLATPDSIDASLDDEVPLAIVGIVPCKVTAENGAIREGDLLVTSSLPGYAMKGTDRRRLVGAVVGKALEPLPKGTGVIQVLVTLQ